MSRLMSTEEAEGRRQPCFDHPIHPGKLMLNKQLAAAHAYGGAVKAKEKKKEFMQSQLLLGEDGPGQISANDSVLRFIYLVLGGPNCLDLDGPFQW